jgi:hypothetical protein
MNSFQKELKAKIEARSEEDFTLTVSFEEGNDCSATVEIKTPVDSRIGKISWPEDTKTTPDDIVNDFMDRWYSVMKKPLEFLYDFDKVKDKIIFKLEPTKTAEERKTTFAPFLDLAMSFFVLIEESENKLETARISDDLIEKWGTDFETVKRLAEENTPELLPLKVMKMADLMKSIGMGDMIAPEDVPMIIVSNKQHVSGSGAMLYQGTLEALAEETGTDLVILPSSIHEVIVIPMEDGADPRLSEMVQEVNAEEVAEDEVLSDHAYRYDRKRKEIYCL